MISYCSSTQLIRTNFSAILESDIDPEYISMNVNPIPTEEIPRNAFSVSLLYNLTKSVSLNHSHQVAVT